MKRILLSLLAIVLVLGLFAAVGFAGYRIGYAQGAQGTGIAADERTPQLRPFDNDGPQRLPQREFGFGREFRRGFGMRAFPMMGFGLLAALMWLGRILVLALIIWFIYWLVTRSGWRLTREPVSNPPPPNENE